MLKATLWLSGGAQIPTQAQPLSPNLVLILASPQVPAGPSGNIKADRVLRLLVPLTQRGRPSRLRWGPESHGEEQGTVGEISGPRRLRVESWLCSCG